MPTITPDFTEAVESTMSDEPMPAGEYQVRVTDAEMKTSKAGNPYIKWKLQVFGMEGDLARFNNWPIFYNTMLTGRGAGILKSFLKCVMPEYEGGAIDTDEALGAECIVNVKPGMKPDGTPSGWPDVKSVRPL